MRRDAWQLRENAHRRLPTTGKTQRKLLHCRDKSTNEGAFAMGRLSTHVLDTAQGKPAGGVAITLHRLNADGSRTILVETRTNADGRTDAPLLSGDTFICGRYEIVFAIGDYFRAQGAALPEPAFLDEVPIRFGIAEPDGHYHVPLLASPWGCTTYRGS